MRTFVMSFAMGMIAVAHAAVALEPLTVVNAANYVPQVAPGSIATGFAEGLSPHAATTVSICAPDATTCTTATVIGVYSGQVNFLVPAISTPTLATVQVSQNGTVDASGPVPVSGFSPGIFTADNSAHGIFSGQAYDEGRYALVYLPGSPITPRPVSPVSGNDANTLILYGTGWANAASSGPGRATVGGTAVTADYAGPSSSPGLDQINVKIPAGLAGTMPKLVDVTISFGNLSTNTVQFCLAGQNGSQTCPMPDPDPAPLCSQPLPGLAAPYAPHGIYLLQPPGQSVIPSTLRTITNEPTVCGSDIYAVWRTIDSGNGQYNWSSVDNLMAPWVAAGKSVNLIVWAVSDAQPNNATPDYVLNDPAYHSVSCANNATSTTLYSYPIYYSDGYKANYKRFIQAVLNRYGSNPSVGYIRFGIARGGEAFPTCLTQMMAAGGYSTIDQFDAVWENYIAEMTAYQTSLLASIASGGGRTVQLMAAINQYGNPIQDNVIRFEAQNAVSLGFGFGSQGLQLSDMTSYNAGRPCGSDWCANFVMFAGQAPLELQTIAASDPTNAPGGTGSMTTLLPFALKLRTQILEVYLQDLQIAYDPNNANYAKYGAAYRQAFENAAAVVGGRY